MDCQKIKTDHAGAKNGGGFGGKRVDAKRISRKILRQLDQQVFFTFFSFVMEFGGRCSVSAAGQAIRSCRRS